MTNELLKSFSLGPAPKVGLRLYVKGSDRYVEVLRRALPDAAWFGPFDAYQSRFDYVLYIQRLDETVLKPFLDFLSSTLLLVTTLDECWALEVHMTPSGRGEVGSIVYRAKTYRPKRGDRRAAESLAELMAARAWLHPGITGASWIVGVPANPPKEPYNLPELLAGEISTRVGIRHGAGLLRKLRPTPEIKSLPNEEKPAAIEGAYEVTRRLDGDSIVLVDDLLYSGTTISHLGNLLRGAGASRVIGLVATKTRRSERDGVE